MEGAESNVVLTPGISLLQKLHGGGGPRRMAKAMIEVPPRTNLLTAACIAKRTLLQRPGPPLTHPGYHMQQDNQLRSSMEAQIHTITRSPVSNSELLARESNKMAHAPLYEPAVQPTQRLGAVEASCFLQGSKRDNKSSWRNSR